ncbi:glycosyltransferase [Providencia rettgeri]
MKIIHIIDSFKIGGVEVGILNLLYHNKDYSVLAVNGADDEFLSSIPEEYRNRITICTNYYQAIKFLNLSKPEIVVSSLWRAHLTSLIFKFTKKNIKRIHFTHNARFAHIIDKLISIFSIKYSTEIYNDSKRSFDWISKYNNRNITSKIIPMNVSFSSEKRDFNPKEITFIYTGRLSKVKRVDISILFIHELKKFKMAPKFYIFGPDNGELNNLKELINNLNLENNVYINPSLHPLSVEKELRKYNFYLQSSSAEGMSISVFQAIKNGLIPVVTPVGEIPNYTEDNFNAIYIDIDDIPKTAEKFHSLFLQSFNGFSPGEIKNIENYPAFPENYFHNLNKI